MGAECGSARDRLGQTLDGKYYLQEILGAGGTAVVYRATGASGESVAIKILHDHLSRSDEVRRRFQREGDLGLIFDHPSTVKVLDDGVTPDGSPYLALEYLEGESLEDRRLRTGGRLDLGEALDCCDQLLAVLELAHEKNVVHRDIKPSNLFLTKSGDFKVLDFGIARLTDDASSTATKTGQTVGTPAFMPPEQALSRPREVDARTDIWSVGATLFTLLSGEHVHIAESSSEHLVKAATLHARSLAKALPGVPRNVEALVARCLSFDKNDRWQSAAEMRAELARVREDPGRRIGTSTFPPPNRIPDASNLTFLLAVPSKPPVPAEASSERDRPSDGSMAISPAHHDLRSRRWLLPIAVASTLGLVVMSAIVFALAIRATPSSRGAVLAAATAPPPEPSAVGAPVTAPVVTIPTASAAEPPPPAPPPPSSAAAAAPTSSAAAIPIVRPRPSAVPKKPASRKDVYRPF